MSKRCRLKKTQNEIGEGVEFMKFDEKINLSPLTLLVPDSHEGTLLWRMAA